MDAVDELLISTLRRIGWSVFEIGEKTKRVDELTPDEIFEAIVRCIWLCDQSGRVKTDVPTYKLPINMASRFKVATAVANALEVLGYKEKIGYQTLLYGSTVEFRRLLVFLTENIPRLHTDADPKAQDSQSLIDQLHAQTKRLIQSSAAKGAWVPWYCHRLNLKWDGRFWSPADNDSWFVPFLLPSDDDAKLSALDYRFLPQPLISAAESSAETRQQQQVPRSLARHVALGLDARRNRQLAAKPALPPKPSLPKTKPTADNEPEKETVEPQATVDPASELDEQLHRRQAQLAELTDTAERMSTQGLQLKKDRKRTAGERQVLEHSIGGEAEQRLAKLLADPEQSLLKLQGFAETSNERFGRLQSQWARHREQQAAALNALRHQLDSKEGNDARNLLRDIDTSSTTLENIQSQMSAKNAYKAQLESEAAKLKSPVNRTAYTRRILDIVASVRKQRLDIDKILEDNMVVQKDINNLTGRLERVFTAVEEGVYREASLDTSLQRAYKLLVTSHQSCESIIQTIEQTGHANRQLLDINHQLETEQQKWADSTMERLVTDYCQVKQHNMQLQSELQRLDNL